MASARKNSPSPSTVMTMLETYRGLTILMDFCFGSFIVVLLGLCLASHFRGTMSLQPFAAWSSFLVFNLLVSETSKRCEIKRALRLEHARNFCNAVFSFLFFIYVEGPITPCWLSFVILLPSTGMCLYVSSNRRAPAYFSLAFFIAEMILANVLRTPPMEAKALIVLLITIAMLAAFFIELTRLSLQSGEKEKQAKAQFVQTSKMSALGEMAGGIAHEINNPLSIIRMTAEQVQELLTEGNADLTQLSKRNQVIEETAMRISKVVIGLRNFCRDESQAPLRKIAITDILRDTLPLCIERLKGLNIDVRVAEISSQLRIQCRPTQISQILLNLLSNASDAIAAKREKWILIDALETASAVQISVTDSGTGIPEDHQEKVFELFFSTKDPTKSSGMGLTVSKGLIESQAGTISLDTSCKNTRFLLNFPKVPKIA